MQRVGGLPLAIELAAPWVRIVGLDVWPNSTTARRCWRWQAGRLGPASQRAGGARLDLDAAVGGGEVGAAGAGTFVGGFGRDGAEAVAKATLATLSALTECALIRRVPAAADGTRYVMHEVVRQYTVDRLEELPPADVEELQRRHLKHLVDLSERFMASPTTRRNRSGSPAAVEQANADVAVEQGIERGDAELVLRLVGNLLDVWIYNGSVNQHRPAIEGALALPWDGAPTRRRTPGSGRVRGGLGRTLSSEPTPSDGGSSSRPSRCSRLDDTGEQAACLRALPRSPAGSATTPRPSDWPGKA